MKLEGRDLRRRLALGLVGKHHKGLKSFATDVFIIPAILVVNLIVTYKFSESLCKEIDTSMSKYMHLDHTSSFIIYKTYNFVN